MFLCVWGATHSGILRRKNVTYFTSTTNPTTERWLEKLSTPSFTIDLATFPVVRTFLVATRNHKKVQELHAVKEKQEKRSRKVTYFNPPFSNSVKTKDGELSIIFPNCKYFYFF